MVGQTLTTKGKPYRYYRCRHAYDKNSGRDCSARYAPAQGLEDAVWREVCRVLSSPARVLDELKRLRSQEPAKEDVASVRRELENLERQERRLVELYVDGGFNKAVLDENQATLRQRRSVLEDRLHAAKRLDLDFIQNIDPERLRITSAAVLKWLDAADEAQRAQVSAHRFSRRFR